MENSNEANKLEKENQKNEQTNNKVKNNKKKIWIIAGIIIVMIIVGITIYFKKSEDNCTNSTNAVNSIPSNKKLNSNLLPFIEVYDAKPIIYLYPQEEIQLTVKLGKEENITCSYPKYNNGWNVIAKPDGTLIDIETGRNLYSLYWEGIHSEECNFTEGVIVKGSDTIKFLEEKLSILGLNELEAEEFIVYWLPKLQENEYNFIRFATLDEINKNMPLELSVEPDTMIRVLMQYKPLDEYIKVKEQELVTPERKGFTVVEWGGTEIK